MPRGGARNRSGPPVDPASGRSDRRGFNLTALPAEGYDGPIPEYPLPIARVYRYETKDGRRSAVFNADATATFSERELALWDEVWKSPQACAWSMPSEAWRVRTVAMWVRLSVRCEDSEAGASLLGQLHRFADQIGMTTAGLAEMGWKVAVDEVGVKRAESDAVPEPVKRSSRDRMKVVPNASGA